MKTPARVPSQDVIGGSRRRPCSGKDGLGGDELRAPPGMSYDPGTSASGSRRTKEWGVRAGYRCPSVSCASLFARGDWRDLSLEAPCSGRGFKVDSLTASPAASLVRLCVRKVNSLRCVRISARAARCPHSVSGP